MEAPDEVFRSMGIQLRDFTEVTRHPHGPHTLFQLSKALRQSRHDCLLYEK
jgi:hypothetical protein